MFCAKCGNQLGENEKFCPVCGTEVGKSGKTINLQFSTGNLSENFKAGMAGLGKNMVLYFVNLGLLLLSFIFSQINTFSSDYGILKAGLFGMSAGDALGMGDEAASTNAVFVRIIFILIYIAVIAAAVLPLLTGKKWKALYILPGAVWTLFSLLWYFFTYSFFLSIFHSESAGLGFDFSAVGWLFLLTTIGSLVLSVLISLNMTGAIGNKASGAANRN